MSFTCTRRYGISFMLSLGLITALAAPAMAQDTPPTVTVSAGIDVVNQYMFRGIRERDRRGHLAVLRPGDRRV